jgi:hypothetical protein
MKYETITEAYTEFNIKLLEKQIDFMKENHLDYQDILYLKFLFFEQFSLFFKYCDFGKSKDIPFDVSKINKMYSLGILKNKWIKSKEMYPDNNEITEQYYEVVSNIFGVNLNIHNQLKEKRNKQVLFEEQFAEQLYDIYPNSVGGYALKACNAIEYKGKTYDGKLEILKLYSQLINYDIEKHKEVMKAVKADKANDWQVCRVAFSKFVRDSMWNNIKITNWTDEV